MPHGDRATGGELTNDLALNNENLRRGPNLGGIRELVIEGPNKLGPGKTRAGFEIIQTSTDGGFSGAGWHVDDPTDARVQFQVGVASLQTFIATVRIHQK